MSPHGGKKGWFWVYQGEIKMRKSLIIATFAFRFFGAESQGFEPRKDLHP